MQSCEKGNWKTNSAKKRKWREARNGSSTLHLLFSSYSIRRIREKGEGVGRGKSWGRDGERLRERHEEYSSKTNSVDDSLHSVARSTCLLVYFSSLSFHFPRVFLSLFLSRLISFFFHSLQLVVFLTRWIMFSTVSSDFYIISLSRAPATFSFHSIFKFVSFFSRSSNPPVK